MSMRSFAEYAYEITPEKLEECLPGIIEEIDSLEGFEEFVSMQDDEGTEEIRATVKKVVDFGASKGLELSFGWRYLDDGDDAGEFKNWYVYCDNAVTLHPAFKALGGIMNTWVTVG